VSADFDPAEHSGEQRDEFEQYHREPPSFLARPRLRRSASHPVAILHRSTRLDCSATVNRSLQIRLRS
jgi:hypothetical protein